MIIRVEKKIMEEKSVLNKLEEIENLVKELFVKLDLMESAQRVKKNAQSTLDEIHYLQGLIMGLFLGILGNLCVSFLMKTIEAFGTTSFSIWLSAFVLSLVITTLVFLLSMKRIVMLIVSFFKPILAKSKIR